MLPKIQLLAVLAFGVAMLLIENQIQRLDESRARLGKSTEKVGYACEHGLFWLFAAWTKTYKQGV